MTFPKDVFRSYDIRGFLHEITPELAEFVAFALVRKKGIHRLVIGRDMRETSEILMNAAILGAQKAGAEVLSIGLTNTSVFNFAVTSSYGADGGIMITASHNPAAYNGMKAILSDGMSVSGSDLYEMVVQISEEDFASSTAKEDGVNELSVLEAYLEKCLEEILEKDFSDFRAVIDYGNGMGVVSVAPTLEKLRVQTIELYKEPDARFPNHEANPAKVETLKDAQAAVLREKAHLGIALDGDVDRVRFIDEKGRAVRSDAILALFARRLLKDRPGAGIVVTIDMGEAVREAIVEAGGRVLESPVGRTNVPIIAKKGGGIMGGEASGHFTFDRFAFLEAVDYAIVLLLDILRTSKKPLSELTNPLMDKYANSGEVNIEMPRKTGSGSDGDEKDAALERILAHFEPLALSVNRADGIKCIFPNWWFIVRKSNTEPVIRLTVEADSMGLLEEKKAEVLKVLQG